MNVAAKKHLDKAETYLGKGDELYGKAADEIIAAKEADFTLSNREIGERFGHKESWVRDIVTWRTSSECTPTPWAIPEENDRTAASHAKTVLRKAPMETVEKIIADLPADRLAAVTHAALDRPGVAEEFAKDKTAHQKATRLSEASREAMVEQNRQLRRKTTAFSGATNTLGVLVEVLGKLVGARGQLNE